MQSMENANSESHYKFLVLAIVVGLLGVFLRFADFHYASAISNILLVIGSALVLRGVFKILD
ncbi:hypothetical protein [Mucilaginibacter pedocola]|uniref:Gliding motility protein GldL n=1 Tax=Mucilaginibacter pedocola TaxID=1792845 RepID=A0A1S9PBC3_9SPHI|nr:hypothetical protein [Mucilaginibacter pedocola]OOQ58255.1 hypothetical protein BC343_11475 [Mucilaginibacter pedocola]